MDNYCVLCGEVLENGEISKEHHQFKRMCLNCNFRSSVAENGDMFCLNPDNMESIKAKMLSAANAVTEAYGVKNLEISPLPLKKPTAKCKQWCLSDVTRGMLEEMFQ